MSSKILKIIVALLLLALSVGIAISTYTNQQQKNVTSTQAATPWQQCNADATNTPCGQCDVISVDNGDLEFVCQLICGGESEADCPEGPGTQTISGKWLTCDQDGVETCDSSKSDFKQEGVITNSPWTLARDSQDDFIGSFPEIQCGRASVELLMNAAGVDVTQAVYDTQVACTVATGTPTPTVPLATTPGSSVTPGSSGTPAATVTVTVAKSPTPSITGVLSPTNSPTPSSTSTPTMTTAVIVTEAPPVSGIPLPVIFIFGPMILLFLGLAL